VEHGEVLGDDDGSIVAGAHLVHHRADGLVVDGKVPHRWHSRAGEFEDLAGHRGAGVDAADDRVGQAQGHAGLAGEHLHGREGLVDEQVGAVTLTKIGHFENHPEVFPGECDTRWRTAAEAP
jgi:hypothetical protein